MVHKADSYFFQELVPLVGFDESKRWFETRKIARQTFTIKLSLSDSNRAVAIHCRSICSTGENSARQEAQSSCAGFFPVHRAKNQSSFSELGRCSCNDVNLDIATLPLPSTLSADSPPSTKKGSENVGLLYTDAAHLVLDKCTVSSSGDAVGQSLCESS
jgi:hypothetical protein